MPRSSALTKRSPSMSDLRAKLALANRRTAAIRSRTKGSASAIEPVICVLTGAALGGALVAKKPKIGPIDSRLAGGAVLVGAGIFGVKDLGWKRRLILAGAGMAAPLVSEAVEKRMTSSTEDAPEEEEVS